ncbi:MAG: tRNA 2-thiouridine(34) synthase MnmA [Ruminococcaceae bacterium]|nr:tRNA 2-thiouridine(34) synthase MnmA [Oscillospiraceae bacterium]
MNKKALVAMSGGVDSSVAAYLMKKEGYEISGAIMRLCDDFGEDSSSSVNDARMICERLDAPFYVFDYRDDFKTFVVEDFVRVYDEGGTPNPCVVCNKKMKFGKFIDGAKAAGIDLIATGHYARIEKSGDRFLLKKGLDSSKDQSYFLYHLTQNQLSHTLFPLGSMSKDEIREIAKENGFVTAHKKESQDICFVPSGDYVSVIEKVTSKVYPGGNFVNPAGEKIGNHKGHIYYTIGQRKGLGMGFGEKMYVLGKDAGKNEVILGSNHDLFSDTLFANDFNWIVSDNPPETFRADVKIRYGAKEAPATVYVTEKDCVKIVFDTPQRAIAPGQAVVLYDGDVVLGGGTITEREK